MPGEEDTGSSSGCLFAMLAVGLGVPLLVLTVVLLQTLIGRARADRDIQPLCQADGGIRIFEKAQLRPGEAMTIGPTDWAQQNAGRAIGSDYKLRQSYVHMRLHGASVYKYTTWVERTSDQKRLSELTWYFREGDEVFHGKHCPENPSEDNLVRQTLAARTSQ